jgi:hypothetical protein
MQVLGAGSELVNDRLSLAQVHALVKAYISASYKENAVAPELHAPDQRLGLPQDVPIFPNVRIVVDKVQKAIGEDSGSTLVRRVGDLTPSLGLMAFSIPLEERNDVHVGLITDREALRASDFILVVRADVPSESIRRRIPRQIKICAVEDIQALVQASISGIAVQPLPVAPRQIPFYAGAQYFELDRGSTFWQRIQTSAAFAIHVSGEFPNLTMELWAVRSTPG